uniref:interleukin-8-like n=1 Tax=Myxine glutinosa TaxID=7769 RepID=UPI00358E0DF0
MNSKYIVALAIVLIVCSTFSEAIPIGSSGRCLCLEVTSNFYHPSRFHQLEIIPQNLNCPHTEILLTLKSDLTKQICLNPRARWVKKVMDRLLKSRSERPSGEGESS